MKKADKGLAAVVCGLDHYYKDDFGQLEEENFYEKVEYNHMDKVISQSYWE